MVPVVVTSTLVVALCVSHWTATASAGSATGTQWTKTRDPVDWLLDTTPAPATLTPAGPCRLALSNGLLTRVFALPGPGCTVSAPNWATLDLLHAVNPDEPPVSVLAALDAEAFVELDGVTSAIGGFADPCPEYVRGTAQTDAAREGTCAYLNRSQPSYTAPLPSASAWVYAGHQTGPIVPAVKYTPRRHAAAVSWPPAGLHLSVDFRPPHDASTALRGITVTVHYELLQGVPFLSKWVEVTAAANNTVSANVVVGNVTVELLRVNDPCVISTSF